MGTNPHDLYRIDCHDLRIAMRLKLFDDVALRPYLSLRRTLRVARRGAERLFGRV
jgi:hypothetical protein